MRNFTDRGGKRWQVSESEEGGGGVRAQSDYMGLPRPQPWLLVFHADGEVVGVPAEHGTLARMTDEELRAVLDSNRRR